MSRSFFKDNLASRVYQKKAAAAAADGSANENFTRANENFTRANKDAANANGETAGTAQASAELYDDVSVCRMLRVHRRVLDAARTQAARGKDWDCIGLHAGMTKRWVIDWAALHGIVPDFAGGHFEPIKPHDGVVSVRLVGTHPNPCRCTVEIVATGEREFCSVRDLYKFPIHYREVFDAKRVGTNLEWVSYLNACSY